MTKTAVRKADAADVPALAGALARAFDDDPVMAWLFPDPARRTRTLPRFFSAHLTKIVMPHDAVYTSADVAGGALWEPPGKWRLGARGQLRMLPDFIRLFGRRLPLASRVTCANATLARCSSEGSGAASALISSPVHAG